MVVQSDIPVSSTPFGEIQLELPVKEDLPTKEKHMVSEKEVPGGKPAFDKVQVLKKQLQMNYR